MGPLCPLGAPAPKTVGEWGWAWSPRSCWWCWDGGSLSVFHVVFPMESYSRCDVPGTAQAFPGLGNLFPILSLSGGMRWTLTCGPTVGCSLLFGRHGETEARCGTQRCMGILKDVDTLSPIPCSAGFCLPSPSLATHHALGHIWYWLRKQWGRGHTDTPLSICGAFPGAPGSLFSSTGSQCWVLCSPGVPESLCLAAGCGQRAVPVLGGAPSGFQLTNARRWLPAEELLLRRRLFTACWGSGMSLPSPLCFSPRPWGSGAAWWPCKAQFHAPASAQSLLARGMLLPAAAVVLGCPSWGVLAVAGLLPRGFSHPFARRGGTHSVGTGWTPRTLHPLCGYSAGAVPCPSQLPPHPASSPRHLPAAGPRVRVGRAPGSPRAGLPQPPVPQRHCAGRGLRGAICL